MQNILYSFSKLNISHEIYIITKIVLLFCLDEMAASIRYEIERLKRRGHRNIDHGSSMSMSPSHSEGSNSDSEGMPMSPDPSHNDGSSSHISNIKKETLFTYKQVSLEFLIWCAS